MQDRALSGSHFDWRGQSEIQSIVIFEIVSHRNARSITVLIARIGGHLDRDPQHLSDDVHVHLQAVCHLIEKTLSLL